MRKTKRSIFIITIALTFTSCKERAVVDSYASVPYVVSEAQIPPSIRKVFHDTSKNSPIVRSRLFTSGDRLIFYEFQFKEDSKLRVMTISPAGKIIMVFDAPEKVDPPNF